MVMGEVCCFGDVLDDFETGFLSVGDSLDEDNSAICAIPLLKIRLISPEVGFCTVEPLIKTCRTPPPFTPSGSDKPIELNASLKADKGTLSRVTLGPLSSVVVTMPTPGSVPATSAN